MLFRMSCSSRHLVSSQGQQLAASSNSVLLQELRPSVRPSLCSYRPSWYGLGASTNGRWGEFDHYSSALTRNWSADRRSSRTRPFVWWAYGSSMNHAPNLTCRGKHFVSFPTHHNTTAARIANIFNVSATVNNVECHVTTIMV